VERARVITQFLQSFSQNVRSFLLVDEDDDRRIDSFGQVLHQLAPLVVLGHDVDDLFDSFRRFSDRPDVHHRGASQVCPGQPLHGRGHGRRKHHSLSILLLAVVVGQQNFAVLGLFRIGLEIGDRHVLEDLLDVRFEAQIDHPVGLVHHDVGALVEDQVAVLQHVDQTTRSCDDDLAAHPQPETLLFSAETSDDDHGADPQRLSELDGFLFDLLREFTSGGQDDGVGTLIGVFRALDLRQGLDPGQQGDEEREGLAGAGLGDADDVPILHSYRNGLPLDGRRVLVTHFIDDLEQFLLNSGLFPAPDRLRNFSTCNKIYYTNSTTPVFEYTPLIVML
jgi:hypothetical protein